MGAVEPDEPVTIEAWQAALDAAKLQEEHALDAEWRNLTGSAQRVLRAVTLNVGRPFQKQAAEAVGVPIGSVDRVSDALVGAYVLRQTGRASSRSSTRCSSCTPATWPGHRFPSPRTATASRA